MYVNNPVVIHDYLANNGRTKREGNKELRSRRVKSGDHSRKYKILQDYFTNTIRCHPI